MIFDLKQINQEGCARLQTGHVTAPDRLQGPPGPSLRAGLCPPRMGRGIRATTKTPTQHLKNNTGAFSVYADAAPIQTNSTENRRGRKPAGC